MATCRHGHHESVLRSHSWRTALDFPDDSFDVVHAHQVLQHVADPVQALREMRRLDDLPLTRYSPEALPDRRVIIPQEAYVFAGTLAENIGYLRAAPREELDAAAEAVGLSPLVSRLGGYDAILNPSALSAGERQLIALTRAYLSAAPIAILDEATCHLDPAAEALAEESFARRPGLLIVIAHRISSALRAGQILVAYVLTIPVAVLILGSISLVIGPGTRSILNPGMHGLTEVTYAFASAAQNNGSAFAGLAANTTWYNSMLGLIMLIGRFMPIVLALAIAGSLAGARVHARTRATLDTTGPTFGAFLVGVIVVVGGLIYFPMLILGPIGERIVG
jgi:hypothetical protein